ncbi:MAG TPA: DUF721 domain-containing protein [Burkholderiales bacterium]|nr:DUF721 domain-containing protein [Burkholderiales bacterium]
MMFIVPPPTPMPIRAPGRRIGLLLSSVPALKASSVQLERIAAMQHTLTAALPKPLAGTCRVAYEADGTLVIEAKNGAVAAKVQALSRRLLATLRQHYPALSGIRVEVGVLRRSKVARGAIRRIGPTGMRSLVELEGSLPDGPLRMALRRLLATSDRQNQALEDEKREHHAGHDQGVREDPPGHTQPAPVLRDEIQRYGAADHQHDQEADEA